jgi:hypothetical protein
VKLISSVSGGALALALGAVALPAAATTVTIPEPPAPFWVFGQGDVSVTYDGVTFTQSATLGDAFLDDIGHPFAPGPAVLSSQQAPSGVENILITLPSKTTTFSLDYGTIDGHDVSFVLSNGASITKASVGSGSGYDATEVFQTTQATPFNTVLVTSHDLILNVNNISFSAAPEPGGWAMMIIGIGALGLAARRRKAIAVAV